MYEVIKTSNGFMVCDRAMGEYAHDEKGDNSFDSEDEAKKLLLITRMRNAIDNLFEAVEEGDAESTAHLALHYKKLFGTKEKVNE